MNENDLQYMARALQLAIQGAGHVSPNPMVGAVIVCDNRIIGEGWHRQYGQGHAEVNAVASVPNPDDLKRSTLYVTLEPCSHYGKTPPCAQLIIDRGIPRVVVGTLDPFPQVAGRGVEMLRQAGVEVTVGVLEQQCRQLNRRFITAHTTHRPWVQLKWAQTADGCTADSSGTPLQLSTPATATLMHRHRALCDAIVVGANTVRNDDPSLTTRLWPGRDALRVVLDRHLSIPDHSRLLTDGGNTIIYNATLNDKRGNVQWVQMDTDEPQTWLADLYNRGITSVMVEGGRHVLQQLIDADMWNEARIEVVPRHCTSGIGIPAPSLARGTVRQQLTADGNTIVVLDNSHHPCRNPHTATSIGHTGL